MTSLPLARAEIMRAVDEQLVVVSVTKRPTGHVTRRTHLSLKAGQASVDRAHARGDAAVVILARLEQVATL